MVPRVVLASLLPLFALQVGPTADLDSLPVEYSIWRRNGTRIGELQLERYTQDGGDRWWYAFDLVDDADGVVWSLTCLSRSGSGHSDLVCVEETRAPDGPTLVLTSSTGARLSGAYCIDTGDCLGVAPAATPPRADGVWLEVLDDGEPIAWVEHGYDTRQEIWVRPDVQQGRLDDLMPLFFALGVTWDFRDVLGLSPSAGPRLPADEVALANAVRRFEKQRALRQRELQEPVFGPAGAQRSIHLLIELLSVSANIPVADRVLETGDTNLGLGGGFNMYFGGEWDDLISLYTGFDAGARQTFDREATEAAVAVPARVETPSFLIRVPLGVRLTLFRLRDWRPYVGFELAYVLGGRVSIQSGNFVDRDPDSFLVEAKYTGIGFSPALGARYRLSSISGGGSFDAGFEARFDVTDFGETPVNIRYGGEPDQETQNRAEATKSALEAYLADQTRTIGTSLRVFLSARW